MFLFVVKNKNDVSAYNNTKQQKRGAFMRAMKCILGFGLTSFAVGLLLSCILPNFALVCLLAVLLAATGIILLGK